MSSSSSSSSFEFAETNTSASHVVVLRLVEARSLRKTTTFGKQKPHVQIRLGKQHVSTHKSTTAQGQQVDFEQRFKMYANPETDALQLTIKHVSMMSDKNIGSTAIPLNAFPLNTIVDEWFTIWGTKGSPSGVIRLRLLLRPGLGSSAAFEELPPITTSYGSGIILHPELPPTLASRGIFVGGIPPSEPEFIERSLLYNFGRFGHVDLILLQSTRLGDSLQAIILFDRDDASLHSSQPPRQRFLGKHVHITSAANMRRTHLAANSKRTLLDEWSDGCWMGMKGVAWIHSFTDSFILRSPFISSFDVMAAPLTSRVYKQTLMRYSTPEMGVHTVSVVDDEMMASSEIDRFSDVMQPAGTTTRYIAQPAMESAVVEEEVVAQPQVEQKEETEYVAYTEAGQPVLVRPLPSVEPQTEPTHRRKHKSKHLKRRDASPEYMQAREVEVMQPQAEGQQKMHPQAHQQAAVGTEQHRSSGQIYTAPEGDRGQFEPSQGLRGQQQYAVANEDEVIEFEGRGDEYASFGSGEAIKRPVVEEHKTEERYIRE